MKLTKGYALTAGLLHYWTPTIRQAVFGSYLSSTAPSPAGQADFKEYRVGSNLIWSPVSGLDIGVEVLYAKLDPKGRVADAEPWRRVHARQRRLASGAPAHPARLLIRALQRLPAQAGGLSSFQPCPRIVLSRRSPIMTDEQCRLARAMLGWSAAELSRRAQVGLRTIREFEANNRPHSRFHPQQAARGLHRQRHRISQRRRRHRHQAPPVRPRILPARPAEQRV